MLFIITPWKVVLSFAEFKDKIINLDGQLSNPFLLCRTRSAKLLRGFIRDAWLDWAKSTWRVKVKEERDSYVNLVITVTLVEVFYIKSKVKSGFGKRGGGGMKWVYDHPFAAPFWV